MKRILIVDDEQMLLQGLSRVLEDTSTKVKAVDTVALALAEIASSSYHLCYLDIFLPDGDGTDVLKRIRAVSPETKVIIMTSGIVNRNMKETIERDAYLFIPKPFDLLQIKMLTKRILEGEGI